MAKIKGYKIEIFTDKIQKNLINTKKKLDLQTAEQTSGFNNQQAHWNPSAKSYEENFLRNQHIYLEIQYSVLQNIVIFLKWQKFRTALT